MNFVDRVLILRDKTSSVQTFRLKCVREYNLSHFNTWICSAIVNGVRKFDLRYLFETDNLVHLPRTLFTCEKLEVLKLHGYFCIRTPKSVFLPSLRVLHLIAYDTLATLGNLISGCPVLVKLVVQRDYCDSLHDFVINSCSLKSLSIHADNQYFDHECNIIVDAPNLEYVDLSHYLSGIHMGELPSLVEANMDVVQLSPYCYVQSPYFEQEFVELLRSISNVRRLSLTNDTIDNLNAVEPPITMPKFCNLSHLEVEILRLRWIYLPEFLVCAPHLQSLVSNKEPDYENDVSPWCMPDWKPKCMSTIEMITINGFDGCEPEIELVRYFLKNAKVLKEMIVCACNMYLKEESAVLKELLRFPRRSESCELVFC